MADQTEPTARYPRQEVAEGQKAGYIGNVEVYDLSYTGGASNAKPEKTTKTAKDSTPDETPIVGSTGVIGGTIDNVSPSKG